MTKHIKKNQIIEWANMWSQHAHVKFNDAAWSYLGTDCTSKFKTINLRFIDQGMVLHELGYGFDS